MGQLKPRPRDPGVLIAVLREVFKQLGVRTKLKLPFLVM